MEARKNIENYISLNWNHSLITSSHLLEAAFYIVVWKGRVCRSKKDCWEATVHLDWRSPCYCLIISLWWTNISWISFHSSVCSLYALRVGRALKNRLKVSHTVVWSISGAWDLEEKSTFYSLGPVIDVLGHQSQEATEGTWSVSHIVDIAFLWQDIWRAGNTISLTYSMRFLAQ